MSLKSKSIWRRLRATTGNSLDQMTVLYFIFCGGLAQKNENDTNRWATSISECPKETIKSLVCRIFVVITCPVRVSDVLFQSFFFERFLLEIFDSSDAKTRFATELLYMRICQRQTGKVLLKGNIITVVVHCFILFLKSKFRHSQEK